MRARLVARHRAGVHSAVAPVHLDQGQARPRPLDCLVCK